MSNGGNNSNAGSGQPKNDGPNAAAPPPVKDPFEVFAKVKPRIVEMKDETWFNREASFLLQAITTKEDLAGTTPRSQAAALLQLANTGLTLNPLFGFAYVVKRSVKIATNPNKWESRLSIEPSYKGLIKAATDTGSIKLIRGEIVYAGDRIQYIKGTTVQVIHSPYWQEGKTRGEVVAAYSVATLHDGTIDVLDMGLDELLKVMGTSDAVKKNEERKRKGESTIPNPNDTWREEMFRKAPIKRHLKTLPKTELLDRLFHAIEADNEQFGSAQGEEHRAATALGEVREVRLALAEALDFYQGEDREDIRREIQAKVDANEFTADYGRNVMASLRGLAQ